MGFASAAVEATKVSIAKVQKERAETLKYSKVLYLLSTLPNLPTYTWEVIYLYRTY